MKELLIVIFGMALGGLGADQGQSGGSPMMLSIPVEAFPDSGEG